MAEARVWCPQPTYRFLALWSEYCIPHSPLGGYLPIMSDQDIPYPPVGEALDDTKVPP